MVSSASRNKCSLRIAPNSLRERIPSQREADEVNLLSDCRLPSPHRGRRRLAQHKFAIANAVPGSGRKMILAPEGRWNVYLYLPALFIVHEEPTQPVWKVG